MRRYEVVYILDPGLDEAALAGHVDRYSTLITGSGGEVLHIDRWERRRLAYDIKGRREGMYVVMVFKSAPAAKSELDRILRITDGVLRHIIVLIDERHAGKMLADAQQAAEAKARAEAEQRAAAEAAAAEAAAAEAEAADLAGEAETVEDAPEGSEQ